MAQGSTQIMGNINALFLHQTVRQKSMFDQVMASLSLLNQRQNVLSQNVAKQNIAL